MAKNIYASLTRGLASDPHIGDAAELLEGILNVLVSGRVVEVADI